MREEEWNTLMDRRERELKEQMEWLGEELRNDMKENGVNDSVAVDRG